MLTLVIHSLARPQIPRVQHRPPTHDAPTCFRAQLRNTHFWPDIMIPFTMSYIILYHYKHAKLSRWSYSLCLHKQILAQYTAIYWDCVLHCALDNFIGLWQLQSHSLPLAPWYFIIFPRPVTQESKTNKFSFPFTSFHMHDDLDTSA